MSCSAAFGMSWAGGGGGGGAGAGGGATTAGAGGGGGGGAGAGGGGGGGATAGGGATGAGAEATDATGRFGQPETSAPSTRIVENSATDVIRVCMSVVLRGRVSSRRSVLEDLAGAHRDRVEAPPVLLPRLLDVRPVHVRVRAILVVAHGEEPVLPRREVRVVGEPHVPVLAAGATRAEEQDRGDHCDGHRLWAHTPPPVLVTAELTVSGPHSWGAGPPRQ